MKLPDFVLRFRLGRHIAARLLGTDQDDRLALMLKDDRARDLSVNNAFFFHIPKTAGTSFNGFIGTRFAVHNVYIGAPPEEVKPSPDEFGVYYAAHTNWDIFSQLPPIDFTPIVFLREPRARLRSAYFFTRASEGNADSFRPYARACKRYDFKDWMKFCVDAKGNDEGDENNSDNQYLRCLAGRELVKNFPKLDEVEQANLLDVALQNLETFSACGLVEQYDASVKLICRVLDIKLPRPHELVRSNVNAKKPEEEVYDDEMEALLHQLTCFDSKIYERGQVLFREQCKAHLIPIEE